MRKKVPKKGITQRKAAKGSPSREKTAFYLSDDWKQNECDLREFQRRYSVGTLKIESVRDFYDLCKKVMKEYGERTLQWALLRPETTYREYDVERELSSMSTTNYRGAATIVRYESGRFKVHRQTASSKFKGRAGAKLRVRIPKKDFGGFLNGRKFKRRIELSSIEICKCMGDDCQFELHLKVKGIDPRFAV